MRYLEQFIQYQALKQSVTALIFFDNVISLLPFYKQTAPTVPQ